MRRKAVCSTIVALALGGCLGPEAVPSATGSLSPMPGMRDLTRPAMGPKPTLADAVTACLDRGTLVQTPAFRDCVIEAQQSAGPRANATLQAGALAQ